MPRTLLTAGGGKIKSIQHVLFDAPATTSWDDEAIVAVDRGNCLLIPHNVSLNGRCDALVTYKFNSDTSVRMQKINSTDGAKGGCTIVEFKPGFIKSNQYSFGTILTANTSVTVAITEVDADRALLISHGSQPSSTISGNFDKGLAHITLTNDTTVTASRFSSGTVGCQFFFQVAEFK